MVDAQKHLRVSRHSYMLPFHAPHSLPRRPAARPSLRPPSLPLTLVDTLMEPNSNLPGWKRQRPTRFSLSVKPVPQVQLRQTFLVSSVSSYRSSHR